MHETANDGAIDGGCAGCLAAIARVQEERRAGDCADCGERYLPAPFPAAGWRPGEPAADLRLLARWLPAMDARSPALARVGWSGHNGASGSARGGRLDHVDERSAEFGRAVAVWQHLRAMVARSDGAAVALLWTAWALAPVVDDPRRDLRARVEAVALGAAPRTLRQDWRARSREVGRVRVVASPHTVITGRGEDGAPVLREVVRRSAAIVSTQGAGVPRAGAGVGRGGAADAVGACARAGRAGRTGGARLGERGRAGGVGVRAGERAR